MARRKKDDGGGVILVLFGLAVGAFIVLLTLVVGFGVCPFVLGTLVCAVMAWKKPKMSHAAEFYSAEDVAALHGAQAKQTALKRQRMQAIAEADQLGLERRSHDHTRFDARQVKARRINANLETIEARFRDASEAIEQLSGEVLDRYGVWQTQMRRWRFWVGRRNAFGAATVVFLATVNLLYNLVHAEWLQETSAFVAKYSLLPTDSSDTEKYGPLLVGFGVASLVTFVAWMAIGHRDAEALDDEPELTTLWNVPSSEEAVAAFLSDDATDSDSENVEDAGATSNAFSNDSGIASGWYVVLGISASASPEEIKAAYRSQIKQYHPDKVASLGPKLRALAEEQTRALNAAYEEGLKKASPWGRH